MGTARVSMSGVKVRAASCFFFKGEWRGGNSCRGITWKGTKLCVPPRETIRKHFLVKKRAG